MARPARRPVVERLARAIRHETDVLSVCPEYGRREQQDGAALV
jgi:hypothetical protein